MKRLGRWISKKKWLLAKVAGALAAAVALFWVMAPFLAPDLAARGKRLPSVIWSRPELLDPRLPIREDDVRSMLKRRGYAEGVEPLVEGQYRTSGAGSLEIRRRAFSTGDLSVDADTLTLSFDGDGRLTAIADGRGNALDRAELEPEILGRVYGKYWHDRMPVTIDRVPEPLVTALIETEDRRFWSHSGVDVRGIAGALIADLRARRVVRGGSTITQQLVKNLWLSSERTATRKLKEAFLAYLLERRYSKKEILETYLNEVYLGQRGPVAIHGFGQAAYHYFGKQPEDLTLSECAFLVGLVHAPGLHDPQKDFDSAVRRRDFVLKLLLTRGRITQDVYDKAVAEPLGVRPPPRFDQPAPFVSAWVQNALSDKYSMDELTTDGLQVHTTIDARLQRMANDAVQTRLAELERKTPRLKRPGKGPLEAAVVVLTPHSGEILALVGGRDYKASQLDRATQSRRQPGSTFKPIVALAALEDEDLQPRITLSTLFDDLPLEVKTPTGTWHPMDYDRMYRGKVTLREALRDSLNIPMVRVCQRVGPKRVVEVARRLGITSPLEPVAPIALGSSAVTPLEMTEAYAVLASEGLFSEPTAINAVQTGDGRLVRYHGRDVDVRFTPAETFVVTQALRDAADNGTGHSIRALGFTGALAGKTGTSDLGRDLWFIGYTPDLVVGVWLGYDDGSPTNLTSAAATPIVADILNAALGAGYDRDFEVPPGVEKVAVDPGTGLRAGFGCGGVDEWYLSGTAPIARCGLVESIRRLLGS